MRLKRFQIQNYKIIDDTGWIDVNENVTALVGKNESGKTAILRALWKTRNRANIHFDKLNDYPRERYSRERKGAQYVVHTEFTLTSAESAQIAKLANSAAVNPTIVQQLTWYNGEDKIGQQFVLPQLEALLRKGTAIIPVVDAVLAAVRVGYKTLEGSIGAAATACKGAISAEEYLWNAPNAPALNTFQAALLAAAPDATALTTEKASIAELVKTAAGDPLKPALDWIDKNMPVFIYFDDYGQLETRIWLPGYIQRVAASPDEKTRTQRALFNWSNIDPQEILALGAVRAQGETDESVQRRKDKRLALLQSASFSLTGDWVDWWTGREHKLHFSADGEDLVLQVSDEKKQFPIPFGERSQGFQWFFSFYLVFQVESDGMHREAILLLDEPGLHLHPTLQQRLVNLFERISGKNQLLYSTHLPFLVDGDHLERVRTVYLNKETSKTEVSTDVRAGADYDTLFPLQAALGYSIAQTLFLGKKCLVVEGITDYWILRTLDAALSDLSRTGTLDAEIVLVPAGGTSRLMPLASLMFGAAGVHGSNMLVLLDSDKEGAQAKARLDTYLFSTDSRVLPLGTPLGRTTKTTIEDLIERATYLAALNGSGSAVHLSASEQSNASTVDACSEAFQRLGLGEFNHIPKTKAALWLVDRWTKDRHSIEEVTLRRVVALFDAINKKFARV